MAVFKVIHSVPEHQQLGVNVLDDNIYLLRRSDLDPLLHVGTAPSSQPYRYVVVDTTTGGDHVVVVDQESFLRKWTSASQHEFYGRAPLSSEGDGGGGLPALFDGPYERAVDSSIAHPQYEIPTMHIRTTPEDLKELFDNYLEDFAVTANISHISGTDIRQFDNAKFELSGQTSRLFEKLSFSVHLSKQEGVSLGGYRKFKLRACATDPTYIREKLYYDVLESAGLPASRASYIRLFINQEPMGLYLMIDNYKSPFLKNVLGKRRSRGALYQGSMPENPMAPKGLSAGANLAYRGSSAKDYQPTYKIQHEAKDGGGGGLEDLIDFMAFIEDPDPDAWPEKFDVDLFLKNMALEVLMGHVDGYLGAAHNYFLYHDPTTDRFMWLSADLDQTMGNTMIPRRHQELDPFGLLDMQPRRPLMKQIMRVAEYRSRFDDILTTFHEGLFHDPEILLSRVRFLADMIREDVAWDVRVRQIRSSSVLAASSETARKHREQIQQKILQMPLGKDFLDRIGLINFETALYGPIDNHPSIMPLHDWIAQTSNALARYVASKQ